MGIQTNLHYFAKGGGCFLEGTPIRTPNGIKRIEDFVPGDEVISRNMETGKETVSKVERLDVLAARRYYNINYTVNATSEHPFYTKDGIKKVSELRQGDVLLTAEGEEVVSNIRVFDRDVVVYNLINVEPDHNYYAAGFLVHNKGCFPGDSLVSTPDGERYMSTLKAGDKVYSYNEKTKQKEVSTIGRVDVLEDAHRYRINGKIVATDSHPFYTTEGVKQVKNLKVKDVLYNEKGEEVEITSIDYFVEPGDPTVYNLIDVLPNRNYYVEGFLVHNKGGGGCFLADTMILTKPANEWSTDSTKIQDLEAGDKIVSLNEKNGKHEMATIGRIDKLVADSYFIINGSVKATKEHPFYTTDGIKIVGELRIGDTLQTFYGEEEITSLERVDEDVVIYNLISVEPNNNYYADDYLVHNKGGTSGARSSSSGSRSSSSSSKSSTPSAPKAGTSTAKPGSTIRTADGKTITSSAKAPSQKGYSTSKGVVGDNGYSPRFTNGYSAPPGSVVYYRDTSFADYLPWIYLFGHSNAAPANQEVIVVQPDGKEVQTKPEPQGMDGLAVFNWILLIVIVIAIIGGIVWGVNKWFSRNDKPKERSYGGYW